MNRLADLTRFYDLLAALEKKTGLRRLADCDGRLKWPNRGVYFFFEPGEDRSDSGPGRRVVRVGTHALKAGATTTLWRRLSQHGGVVRSNGGNHRGSIFRLLVGTAIKGRGEFADVRLWGVKKEGLLAAAAERGCAQKDIRRAEHPLEVAVSLYIRAMPFLWLDVGDDPDPRSHRGVIERNSIALLSNYTRPVIDPPSGDWLGRFCDRERVRMSGLWNNNHVEESYDSAFFALLEKYIYAV